MTIKTIPDIFRRCRGRETGHWRVGGEFFRTIHLDSGDIVFASSNFPTDKLSAIMVSSAKLTQEQMDFALANLRPGMTIGKNLIEMGFITQRDLLEVARLQVDQIVRFALHADESPIFEIRDELEENIVRLPLNTPALLFAGIMAVTDREGLLELLGPLNQVVLLQGKRIYDELDLPADLLKMTRMMDGTHTILELSSEAGVEPMRVSSFALFLREMGWGKLFELPPIDRQAVTKALDTPEPTKPPSNIPSPRNQLMKVIEEAAKDTVKLSDSHLEDMLENIGSISDLEDVPSEPEGGIDDNDDNDDKEDKDGLDDSPSEDTEIAPSEPDTSKSVGRVLPYSGTPDQQEPSIRIDANDFDEGDDEPTAYHATNEITNRDKSWSFEKTFRTFILVGIGILAAIGLFSYLKFRNREVKPPFTLPLDYEDTNLETPSNPAVQQNTPQRIVEEDSTTDSPPQAPARNQPTTVTQSPEPDRAIPGTTQVNISREARFRAIADGNAALALEQGAVYRQSIPSTNWTIQLITACENATLERCAQILSSSMRSRPEFLLTPVRLRNGSNCYRLFVGNYRNKNEADKEVLNLLNIFQDPGVQPRVMLVGEITETQ